MFGLWVPQNSVALATELLMLGVCLVLALTVFIVWPLIDGHIDAARGSTAWNGSCGVVPTRPAPPETGTPARQDIPIQHDPVPAGKPDSSAPMAAAIPHHSRSLVRSSPEKDPQYLVVLKGICKAFMGPDGPVQVLANVDLTIRRGAVTGVVGPSGRGKSTLLSILGGIEIPTAGTIWFDGAPLATSERALRTFRREHVAFVFQGGRLMRDVGALDQVAMVFRLHGAARREARERAELLLSSVGIEPGEFRRRPHQLSGGQQQRIALARAFAAPGELIMADEPTASLDEQRAVEVMTLLKRMANEHGKTVVIVSHDVKLLARTAKRLFFCEGGSVTRCRIKAGPSAASLEPAADVRTIESPLAHDDIGDSLGAAPPGPVATRHRPPAPHRIQRVHHG